MLELTDVTKTFVAPSGAARPVLRGVSLRLEAGQSLAIVGPSGSGKSTLLNLMGALDTPTAGRLRVGGRDLAGMDDNALAALRGRQIGFVFQLHHLLPQCSVLENVLLPAVPLGPRAADEAMPRAKELLARVGLEGHGQDRPGSLSGGERQRVALVRALINRPGLLLADEPTGSLDRAAAASLIDLLAELNRVDGVAMVVATHSPALAARMGRVLELRDGLLAAPEGGA